MRRYEARSLGFYCAASVLILPRLSLPSLVALDGDGERRRTGIIVFIAFRDLLFVVGDGVNVVGAFFHARGVPVQCYARYEPCGIAAVYT